MGEEKEGVCLFILVFGVDSINDAQRWRVRKAAEDVRTRRWWGYAISLMRPIGVENEIPDEAFTLGRTGSIWALPNL